MQRGDINVFHGNYVECRDSFFVEGAWSGPFSEGGFFASAWILAPVLC